MTRALDDDITRIALEWQSEGRNIAIATVVETWGSAPRRIGSRLVIDGQGAMQGSVSGGCVEGAVITEGLDAITDGKSRLLDYGVTDDDAFSVGLACGGRIRILVEPVGTVLPVSVLAKLHEAEAKRQPVAYVTSLAEGGARIVSAAVYPDRVAQDRSGVLDDGDTFVAMHLPPIRLVIVGAVHIAQSLIGYARILGMQTILVDPRPAFATAARFEGQVIISDWPDDALTDIGLDAQTAVVTLTHDPKLDDPAITTALRSDVAYLGCLGSTRTHDKRVDRLTQAGCTTDDIARIHAPVGLDIGSANPAEIALSVVGQIVSVMRKGSDRKIS